MAHYLTMDEVVMMHEILIRKFGGSMCLRDPGALDMPFTAPSRASTRTSKLRP